MCADKLELVNLICVKNGVSDANLDKMRQKLLQKDEAELRSMLGGTCCDKVKGIALEHNEQVQTNKTEQRAAFALGYSDAQAQQAAIDAIQNNIDDAYNIYDSQDLGAITGAYDRNKSDDDKLSSKNVWKVIKYQSDGLNALKDARDHKLTRKEYFEQNTQRLKDMILTRLNVLKTVTGVSMLDSLRGKYSKEQMQRIINDYVDDVCRNASMEDIKNNQKKLVKNNGSEEILALTNLTKSAIKIHETSKNKPKKTQDMYDGEFKKSKSKIEWELNKPITFEEVYQYERGCKYDKKMMEHLVQSKAEMQTVVSAYNKYAQFETFSNELLKSGKNSAERAADLLDSYGKYYVLSPDEGKTELKKLIAKSKLPVMLDENGINLKAFPSEDAKQQALNKLIKYGVQEQKSRLDKILDGKTIEDYQRDYEFYNKTALGEDDAKMLAEAMEADNKGVIQRYTGTAAMAGMGLTMAGGVLLVTPLAPLGAVLITAGNALAIGSMVAESGLGYADAFTKEKVRSEELDDLNKNLIMNAAGFIIGYGASKTGMKLFGKLIDKKLSEVFKTNITEGNRAAALKTVISNPANLKNFMQAAGAKISSDFLISYVGDLMMMGVLDTNDDWKSLLKANLIGIAVGTSGDIKDVAGAGIKSRKSHTGSNVLNKKAAADTDKQISPNVLEENKTAVLPQKQNEDTHQVSVRTEENPVSHDNPQEVALKAAKTPDNSAADTKKQPQAEKIKQNTEDKSVEQNSDQITTPKETANADNITAQKMQNVKDEFMSLLKEDNISEYDISNFSDQINNITDIDNLKAAVDIYKFFKSHNIKLKASDIKDITKDNINNCKAIFAILKESAPAVDDIDIANLALSEAKRNSAECIKQLSGVLGDHPTLIKDELDLFWVYGDLTPENTAAKLDFYKLVENDSEINNSYSFSYLISNVDETNLDIAKDLYKRYKNKEINNVDNIVNILQNSSDAVEFAKENMDLLIKYQSLSVNKWNLNLAKAAADRNLSTEDLGHLIKLQNQDKSNADEILRLVKEGKSVKAINKAITFALYKKDLTAEMNKPLSYNPSLAYKLDPKSRGLDVIAANPVEGTLPLKGLSPVKKPLKTLNLPSPDEMILNLDKGRSIKIDIPNEGNVKPSQGDNTIHPEDVSRLGKTEDAGYELCYGVKRNWSNSKIARDLMQNFFNGHGGTLEGVSLDIQKSGGKYKVRISGQGTYDYGYLDALGASSSDVNPTSIGRQYGEGAKIAALSLLTRQGTDYVKFACGEWDMTFKRSSDDINSAHMTQTLSKNKTEQPGNILEFTTDNPELVKRIVEAKDYFGHPYNKDFQNFDYENDYFGIKLLPEGEGGNIYVVQRYETNRGINNSLNGFSLVFKKKPDDAELIAKTDNKFVLNADRDRGQLSSWDIESLVNKYASTMSAEDLAKLISSLEPVWSKSSSELTSEEDAVISGILKAAGSKSVNIDFFSKKYVYMDKNASAEDIQMAKLMGYNPIHIADLKSVGLKDYMELTENKKVSIVPDEVQTRKIKILNEGVRVIQELLPKEKANLIYAQEVDAPKFIFNKGGSPNERAEAITGYRSYKGHWIKESALYTNKFDDLLATWLHELSHKNGGDTSTEFTEALKDIETNIMKILTDNPEALAKMRYLAKLYDEVSPQMSGSDTQVYNLRQMMQDALQNKYDKEINAHPEFEPKSYAQQTRKVLAEPFEYVPYHEKVKAPEPEVSPVSGSNPQLKYEPLPNKTFDNNYGSLPSTSELMSALDVKGSVEVTIPDAGGLRPTNSEKPVIHPEDISKLGVTEKAKIKVRYAEATDWSNFKIARDLMQNFYDGNGHTLEGVTVKVDKTADGYKVRVEGLGNYDYTHLQRIGSSTKPYLVEDLGNFGEGTRIIASSLLAKGSDSVKYGCGEWQLEFGRQNGRLSGDDVVQTLTKNSQPVKGNYMEFTTKDLSMVEELINAKDYFYHPYNKNFQNLEFENEFFGFKHLDSPEKSTIYLGQKYEINNDFKDSPQKLCIMFKKLPNYPELKKLSYNEEFRLSTGCDRVGLNEYDVQSLARRYAKSMTDEELIESVASLEDIWTTANPKDDKITSPWRSSLEYTFVLGLIQEIRNSRNLQITPPKVVAISANTPAEQLEYFQKEGYRFVYEDISFGNIPNAKDLYDQTHKLHSVKPTENEAKKLQLIKMAAEIFAEKDIYQVMPKNIAATNSYVFNSLESNCPQVHAKIEDGKYEGLFIDRNALKENDFMTLVQESICQMLHTAGNDKSANYSYELTDLLSTQVNQFIKDPTVAKRLSILQKIYENIDDIKN